MTLESSESKKIIEQAVVLERSAHQFLGEHKNEQAFESYREAASFYHQLGRHDQAGHCYIKASSCWSKHIGHQPFRKAAESSELAALEFLKAKNFDCAITSFSDAALFYDKESNSAKFSACFYETKRAQRLRDRNRFLHGEEPLRSRVAAFLKWIANLHNAMLWGYGEKPFRTFWVGLGIIFLCAFIYHQGGTIRVIDVGVKRISYAESLYFSVVTFATVGYGDYLPVNLIARCCAVFEALSGIILTPLFLVALTRRYLRMS